MADNANFESDDSLTEEEKEELREQENARKEQEAKTLADAGVPQFRSYDDLIKGYKDLNDEDKVVFPIVKKVAAQLKMTPHQFMKAVEARAEASSGADKPGREDKDKGGDGKTGDVMKEIEERAELKTKLQNRFLRFQMKKDKEGVDIPDSMYDELCAKLPAVLMGKSEEQVKNLDWFGSAYKLYLFELSDDPNLEKVRDKLSAHDKRQLDKLKQLGVPQGGGKGGKGPTEDQKTWGSGIDALPEVKK